MTTKIDTIATTDTTDKTRTSCSILGLTNVSFDLQQHCTGLHRDVTMVQIRHQRQQCCCVLRVWAVCPHLDLLISTQAELRGTTEKANFLQLLTYHGWRFTQNILRLLQKGSNKFLWTFLLSTPSSKRQVSEFNFHVQVAYAFTVKIVIHKRRFSTQVATERRATTRKTVLNLYVSK